MNQALLQDIAAFAEENRAAVVRDIGRVVAINSVEGQPEPGAPFGPGTRDALDEALTIARQLGLEATNCSGYMGYASVGGDGDKYLATISHLDVVPVGEGWTGEPFEMREREGWILGRGVLDDKGPSILCLYALKYLKDRNVPLRYPVRALLGTHEENGMADLTYYLAHYPAPLFCFSPDSSFPLVNGEKGIFQGRIRAKLPLGEILDIHGGVAPNVIPNKAEATVRADHLDSTDAVEARKLAPGVWRLLANGKGGHASLPQGCSNAIGILVDYLLANGVGDENDRRVLESLAKLHRAWDGSLLGVAADDGRFTPLTIVGGVIGVQDGKIVQSVDSRYPTNMSGEALTAAIREALSDVADFSALHDAPPFYMPLDKPEVQVCVNAYNAVTGENAKPFTIGGGTYARHFPNAVAFGPEHPERPAPDFAGTIHGADEAACIDWLIEALQVYILALIELEKLNLG